MEKKVAIFQTHEEAEKADRAYYLSLTPEERLEIQAELIRRAHGDPPPRLARVYRIRKLGED